MSVRLMTTDAIKKDIQVTVRQWPGGIPAEQEDRMKALYGELKRRGQEAPDRPAAPEPQTELADMNDDGLERELRRVAERIGKEPENEDLQNRFADVRFEIKRRSKPAPSVVRREIEFDTPETIAQVEPPRPSNGKSDLLLSMSAMELRANKLVLAQIAAKVAGELLTRQASVLDQITGDDIAIATGLGVEIAKAVFTKLDIAT